MISRPLQNITWYRSTIRTARKSAQGKLKKCRELHCGQGLSIDLQKRLGTPVNTFVPKRDLPFWTNAPSGEDTHMYFDLLLALTVKVITQVGEWLHSLMSFQSQTTGSSAGSLLAARG